MVFGGFFGTCSLESRDRYFFSIQIPKKDNTWSRKCHLSALFYHFQDIQTRPNVQGVVESRIFQTWRIEKWKPLNCTILKILRKHCFDLLKVVGEKTYSPNGGLIHGRK